LLTVLVLACFAAAPVAGQFDFYNLAPGDNPWSYVQNIDSLGWPQYNAVDADGNIYIGDYYGPMHVLAPDYSVVAYLDSIVVANPAYAGAGDTTIPFRYTRGMNTNADGNPLWSKWGALVELDPSAVVANGDTQNVAGLNFVGLGGYHDTSAADARYSPTGPGLDGLGYMYMGYVVGTGPVEVFDPDTWEKIQEIDLPSAPGYSRGIAVSNDGKTIFPGDLGSGPVWQIYTTEDFVTYDYTDSVFEDVNGDTIFWDQKVAALWGPDSVLYIPSDDYGGGTTWEHSRLVALDFPNNEYFYVPMVDSDDTSAAHYGFGPRGVAFSPDGALMYLVRSDGASCDLYQDTTLGVVENPDVIPEGYALRQNYPNPFNPSTEIAFEIPYDQRVTLTVYNLLGQPIRTLISDVRSAGVHTVTWDGKDDKGFNMASGVYIYRLETKDVNLAGRAVLIK
jgi:hypothetical protein